MQSPLRLHLCLWLSACAAGCAFAPAQEGYLVRAPEAGPTKIAPSGYRWVKQGRCQLEETRSVYNADTEAHTMCDWVIAREVAAAPPGCTKDTDCKGERICVIDANASEGSCRAPTKAR